MHFKPFSSFFQFLPLQVEETYFFRDGLSQGLIRFLPPGGRNLPTLVYHHVQYRMSTSIINFFDIWTPIHGLKGAVSYRFSQGLLTLMCNNSKMKADINVFFFLLRRQTSKVYNWLQKFTIQHPVALL